MRTRQTVISLESLGYMGSGEMLKIWLRSQGINPDGKIHRATKKIDDEDFAVYTEVLEP